MICGKCKSYLQSELRFALFACHGIEWESVAFPGSLFGIERGSDTGLATGGKRIRDQGQLAGMWIARTLQIFFKTIFHI